MFAPSTYAARRTALAETVGAGLIVFLGNDNVPMDYPANIYAFRQDGAFLYYGGLDAPGLALGLDAETGETTLYGHDPTISDVIWEGPLASLVERAASVGIKRTAPPEALADAVSAAQTVGRTVHFLPPYRGATTLRLAILLELDPRDLEPSETLIRAVIAQRLIKTDEEVAEIETAIGIARAMHLLAMSLAQPGRTEYEVAGAMEGLALQHGSFPSFPIILTRRGEVLHNHPTNARFEVGDVMLHDAGAAAPSTRYRADITRVSPVGGTFTEKQRALYDLVLGAELASIDACAPGVPFRDIHRLACTHLATGLTALGLMTGDPAEAVAAGAHALFMPHGLGHAMGLDVHDCEGLGEDLVGYDAEFQRSTQFGTSALRFGRRLEVGHVMTVEPGLYLIDALIDQWKADGTHAAFLNFDEIDHWRGLGGIRIEDDIVVTPDGCRVLGEPIPKKAEEVEALVQAGMS